QRPHQDAVPRRHSDPRRAVPFDRLQALGDGAGDHRDAVPRPAGLASARDSGGRLPRPDGHAAVARWPDLHRHHGRSDPAGRALVAGSRRIGRCSGVQAVNGRFFRKDMTMRSKLVLFALASGVAGCTTPAATVDPARGIEAVNVPVVTTADYVFDGVAPGGRLAPGETERLNGWFQGLGVGFGDTIYVDGAYGSPAASQVAQVAGRYGMMVQPGAPVTEGVVQPGTVRVVVSRRRAEVPGCPNWSRP